MSDTTPPPPDEPTADLPGGEPPAPVPFVAIEEEMKTAYLDYAMSVIVSRALPDARDGLKPVHRRILYAMKELGVDAARAHRKSALIVGEVMGKFHPHGDQAIYDAMVRMAQNFAMRLPLLDGQGNYGSMDGDPAAAMRYTEIRLARAGAALLEDIDRNTVDFAPNYDGSIREPVVLPARIPNLLVNGAGGIAVGMATNIPPHNLGEIVDACTAYVKNPDILAEELMRHVIAPDFPTGGIIMGTAGVRSAFLTGRGSIVIRGRVKIEDIARDREAIVITEIPYQVNKAGMIEKIAEAVRAKRIEGIAELRDESDRDGVRVVIELKRDAVADIVLNQLYRYSPLQTTFGVNALALNGGRPVMMTLKELIQAFVEFREEVVTRRTKHDLARARERAHVLAGLAVAVANIDEVIAAIRGASDAAAAREALTGRPWPAGDVAPLIALINEPERAVVDGLYRLSEAQARAILDLRLQRLTALGRDEIGGELETICQTIEGYLAILSSRDRLRDILLEELEAAKAGFDNPRRTAVEETGELDYEDEDLIQREDMVVTVTQAGYIKRVPLASYRAQRRGGRGRAGMAMREEDFVSEVYVASTHTPVLFFSTTGMVYKEKVWRLPLGTPQARGKALVNLLPLEKGETIATIMPLPEDEAQWAGLYAMFSTASGSVRRNRLSDFTNVKANGKIAMKLEEDDRIVAVKIASDRDDLLLATDSGKCIRFPVEDIRVFKGRESMGVRGIRLAGGAHVIGMSILRHVDTEPAEARAYLRQAAIARRALEDGEMAEPHGPIELGDEGDEEEAQLTPERYAELGAQEEFVLTVTENGYGKRTSAYEYRVTGRGGQGVVAIDTSERNGAMVSAFPVEGGDQIMLVTDGGQLIRCGVDDIRIAGRNTQGVTIFRTAGEEKVVSVARLADADDREDDDGEDDENGSAGDSDDNGNSGG